MALKKIPKITNKQIAEKGVQALADRPNLTAQYGTSGLSATQLKLWFDKLATFLAERINEISDAISSDEATNYIRVCLDEYGVDNLGALITAFTDGGFADKILLLSPSAGASEKQALQSIINDFAKKWSVLKESVDGKVSKNGDTIKGVLKIQDEDNSSRYTRIVPGEYVHLSDGDAKTQTNYLADKITHHNSDTINSCEYSFPPRSGQLVVDRGLMLHATVDDNFVIKIKLINLRSVLSEVSIDLPLESVVMDGRYDETTNSIILTLQNGNEVSIPAPRTVDLADYVKLTNRDTFVKEGITGNTETLTDEEKARACEWLGVDEVSGGTQFYLHKVLFTDTGFPLSFISTRSTAYTDYGDIFSDFRWGKLFGVAVDAPVDTNSPYNNMHLKLDYDANRYYIEIVDINGGTLTINYTLADYTPTKL